MAYLINPQSTIEVLKRHQFTIQKRYGQNFLIDTHVLEKMIQASEITKNDFVLEIGPGIGTMSQFLAEAAREVTVVEIDAKLIPILEETLAPYHNVTIIHNDILKVDLDQIVREKNHGQPVKVVANLPYYITTPIIMKLLERRVPVNTMTIMVQKEVGRRMTAGPGTKDYGALSLSVQYYAVAEIMANVPPNCFIPRPEVDSLIVRLTCREQPPVKVNDEAFLFRLIHAAFNQRRKTLTNSLCNASYLSLSKNQVAAALETMSLPPEIRGEKLTLEEFAQLSDLLGGKNI